MTYEKHIEAFERMRMNADCATSVADACATAIDLMRAAEPKDAEAELRECEDVFNDIGDELPPLPELMTDAQGVACTNLIARTRAAARAEGYTQAMESHATYASKYLANELAACKAEVERLEALFQQTHGMHHSWVDVAKRLEAEVEQLREALESWGSGNYAHELETKLSNLRKAAERFAWAEDEERDTQDLLDAIGASR